MCDRLSLAVDWPIINIKDPEDFDKFFDGLEPIFGYDHGNDYKRLNESLFPISLLVEKDYVDKDWTSMYSYYYSKLLTNYHRRCTRYHIFSGKPEDIIEILYSEESVYHGYFTVYGTQPHMRGRSFFNTNFFNLDGKICKEKHKVNILGNTYTLNGFPSSGQDSTLISCAHVSLWALMRYFSEKYYYYKELYHSDILSKNDILTYGRNTPTNGLFGDQINRIIDSTGLTPLLDANYDGSGDKQIKLINNIKGYLLSGIPVLLGASLSPNEGHAVVGIGLTGNETFNKPGLKIEASDCYMASMDHMDIIGVDDNTLPYSLISKISLGTDVTYSNHCCPVGYRDFV